MFQIFWAEGEPEGSGVATIRGIERKRESADQQQTSSRLLLGLSSVFVHI